ncbi:hypothetical protein [Streptomyces sp. NPDC056987]|uniref:hypothetical protein n=1 Tax=Streptomyces sp. NPDC056987 TaxID=3345988 RepID=UPI00363AFC2E
MTADDPDDSPLARISALVVTPWSHPAPPAGVDLDATWQIPAGEIRIPHHNRTLREIHAARERNNVRVTAEDRAAETTTEILACPACQCQELQIWGRWGHPADMVCSSCGHGWRPYADSPEWGVLAMKHSICRAVEVGAVEVAEPGRHPQHGDT